MIGSQLVDSYLKEYFGYDSFRPGQREVIDSILMKNNTIAVFPTGGGKSICFQIPAMIFTGTTIVVSPLISLMKDQVDELVYRGVPAAYISSILPDQEVARRIEGMSRGRYKIVYIAPERFYSQAFLEALEKIHIPFVAVDEAHCISQWGHNFRPAYLKVKDLIKHVGNPVVAAFTATANKKVQTDIKQLLGLKDCKLFISSFDRPNLEFRVEKGEDKRNSILKYIRRNRDKAGIIYAATRNNVEELYDLLRTRGFSVGMYHAGLSSEARNRAQDAFLKGEISVIVATNAFGMGINKSDVRYIIHYNMPKSLENYYQEAGRAGRDGKKACCILYYSEGDYRLNRFMIEGNYPPLKLVEKIYSRIKRKGEQGVAQELLLKSRTVDRHTLQSALRKLIEYNYVTSSGGMVYAVSERKLELTQDEINMHQKVELDKLEDMIEYCRGQECLRRYILKYFNEIPVFDKCGNCSVCNQGVSDAVVEGEDLDQLLQGIFSMSNDPGADPIGKEEPCEPATDEHLFKRLKLLRKKISQEVGEPDSMIFNDDALMEMATVKPVNKKQMLAISGVGQVQLESFGDEFLMEIHRYLQKRK